MDVRHSKSLCSTQDPYSEAAGGSQSALQFCRFLQAVHVAWDQLSPKTRKAIRAASRSGRLLHDSTTTHLGVRLVTKAKPSNMCKVHLPLW